MKSEALSFKTPLEAYELRGKVLGSKIALDIINNLYETSRGTKNVRDRRSELKSADDIYWGDSESGGPVY